MFFVSIHTAKSANPVVATPHKGPHPVWSISIGALIRAIGRPAWRQVRLANKAELLTLGVFLLLVGWDSANELHTTPPDLLVPEMAVFGARSVVL